ncbi:hypothetical protein GCM10011416_15770 [Polaribacter pacificus]|uniref:DUF4251 domain-containing protein n=1 Tax=Polaribacter pacificus TaxID=1775173 RepID=A0A917MFY9_9FLAO|nr:DUF4251 domain-containing protein [Polaribacter pacificus]GGG98462.1 hypothetical protein GCM10011416_15770 [Polaribacter pacificus]
MKTSFAIICSILLFGCASNQSKLGNQAQQESLKTWLDQKNIKVVATAARPTSNLNINSSLLRNSSSGSHINLTDNPNHIKIKGDSIFVQLPYFGTITGTGSYGSDNSIAYEGPLLKYARKFNTKKKAEIIDFQFITKKNELYSAQLTLYSNLTTHLSLSSTNRSTITYTGLVKKN